MTGNVSLFTPVTLRDVQSRNRIMVSPMCQYCAEEGMPTEWHRIHLPTRAVGGAGIVMTEATAVDPRGRITPYDLGIWSDKHAKAFEPITAAISNQDALPGIQLSHAGRKSSHQPPRNGRDPIHISDGGWEALSPSGTSYPEKDPVPTKQMSVSEIKSLISKFAAAARRAADIGFEIVEVHAAHGYLLHQFLSPVTNERTDQYGGDFESRTRILKEVVTAIDSEWPEGKPISVRISATDWLPNRDSWTTEDSVQLSSRLIDSGADLIDVSGGGLHPEQQIPETGPGYQVPYAETIRENTDIAVAAVGKITDPTHADAIVNNGRADVVALGREFLRNPYWPLKAARELGIDIEWPTQYVRARPD